MKKPLSFLAIIILAIVATIPLPVYASIVDEMPTPFYIKDAGSYYEVNNGNLITYLYKAGYNTYYDLDYQPLVYSERFVLEYQQGANWKQRGIPIDLVYKATETAILVTRHYDDWLGTTFDVVYTFTPSSPIKIEIRIQNGKADTYRLAWMPSGITRTAYETKANSMTFDSLVFDWSDVYYSLGNITATSVSDVAQGRKLAVTFNIGYLAAGKSLVIDPSVVVTSATATAVGQANQRKTFYASGRHWVFYYKTGNTLNYKTSSDGVSWNSDIQIGTVTNGNEFAVWYDGTYCYYIYRNNTPSSGTLHFRRGTPNADGTITWSAADQTGIATSATMPTVCVDSAGYPWVAYVYNTYPYVTKSSTNDGTWSTDASFPYQLHTTSGSWWRSNVIPFNDSGRVAAVYALFDTGYSQRVRVKAWNGTAWKSEVTCDNPLAGQACYSATVLGEYIYIGYLAWKSSAYKVNVDKYSYATNAMVGAATDLTSGLTPANGAVAFQMIADTTNSGVWCVYPRHNDEHVYYKYYNGSSWDASWTDWYTDPNGIDSGVISTSSFKDYGGVKGFAWVSTGYYVTYGFFPGKPTVQTDAASDLSYTTATLNGDITSTGGQNADTRGFDWGTSTGNYSWSWNETGDFGIGAFSHGITDLSVNTTYYFRAWAINDGGTGYGTELNFTTLELSIPTVANSAADGIGETAANVYGNITDTGGLDDTTRGFAWGIETGNYTHDWHEDGTFGTGAFNHTFSDLPPDTTIYWLAYATNLAGTGYSPELTFTTLLPLPLAPTNFTATQTGVSSVNLTWAMGLYATDVYIMGKEGQAPADMTDGYLVYSGNGTYVELDGLSLGLNTYYYKAWSSNPTGNSTGYAETDIGGDSMTFLVFALIPLVLVGLWVAKRDGFLAYAASGAFLLLAFVSMGQSSAPNPGEITDVYMGLFWIGIGLTITCALLPTVTREKVVKEDIEGEWENEDMSAFGEKYESRVKPLTREQQARRRIEREARTGIVRAR